MDAIRYAIEQQDYLKAFDLLKEYITSNPTYTDTIAILEASIYIGLNDFNSAMHCIQDGLKFNPVNHELYFMLGIVYESFSEYNKAYLCYENALLHCKDNNDDYSAIEEHFFSFISRTGTVIPKVSIILLNFNQLAHTKNCINSIRHFCLASSYEIICVDNGSLENPEEWLKTQSDIKYQISPINLGFAGGCNAGICMATPGNDIFLLNNDTMLTENALFWLRMGLYEKDEIGASGAVSNCAENGQGVSCRFNHPSEYLEYGFTNNIPMEHPISYRATLISFAMLIKHTAFEKTGLLDERFFPGNYEDSDYCTRLIFNDYKLVLCKNSFIYHIGGAGFSMLEAQNQANSNHHIMEVNYHRYMEKWNIEPIYSFFCRTELIDLMHPTDKSASINCLDIGCACGATLLEIQNRYPNAKLYGIELDPHAASFASHLANVIHGNIETIAFPFDVSFDYIILGDVLEHLVEPGKLLENLRAHLSDQGIIIASIPNILHFSAISKILMGSFSYSDSGVLDRTHLRFFTLYDSVNLLQNSGYEILNFQKLTKRPDNDNSVMNDFLNRLTSIPNVVDKEQFYAKQYVFKARPIS